MPRPAGSRNADFDKKLGALTKKVRETLLERGPNTSLRELAEGAGVSVTQLKHYFGDRDGLVDAVAEELAASGRPYLEFAAIPHGDSAEEALTQYLQLIVGAWRNFGIGRIHSVPLAEGLGDPRRGKAYVNHLLEPTLASCERLLNALIARGDLPSTDVRAGALSLVGPILLALLHQDSLGGAACRPLDVEAFSKGHVATWLRGHQIRA